ncbi:Hypothetical protein PP7435_CHR3-1168 [Komagataella phaffii CBS 7435]|uniref:Uncharacterized protein n=2 Tax=Komagataella phaffii TaxID=460519 RepID=C4R3G6_KOMPG|nr:uncharacterized protein PAS_chr3_1149 [Komagataella phaffii GS115]AOA63416.1 GQ67_03084T0 [Komagataella phaffii]CAH2450279.1 Hypothetical protein BQ9382_C3-6165 [Komagataella phaffii CBS 7435]AOA69041.1 GQ68_03068T0 [Komagataella phaffii GS115]CAY70001.1 hypothetical protein PAS_chr3_1149 [Komagataella phaffii GS115]CCA40110.1 Hypothetical protein PP7435_CHR3-1168 [Komagataella phaffii CBS 7435]
MSSLELIMDNDHAEEVAVSHVSYSKPSTPIPSLMASLNEENTPVPLMSSPNKNFQTPLRYVSTPDLLASNYSLSDLSHNLPTPIVNNELITIRQQNESEILYTYDLLRRPAANAGSSSLNEMSGNIPKSVSNGVVSVRDIFNISDNTDEDIHQYRLNNPLMSQFSFHNFSMNSGLMIDDRMTGSFSEPDTSDDDEQLFTPPLDNSEIAFFPCTATSSQIEQTDRKNIFAVKRPFSEAHINLLGKSKKSKVSAGAKPHCSISSTSNEETKLESGLQTPNPTQSSSTFKFKVKPVCITPKSVNYPSAPKTHVKKISKWIGISKLTDERVQRIYTLATSRKLKFKDIQKSLSVFTIDNIQAKVDIIGNLLINRRNGIRDHPHPILVKDKNAEQYEVNVRTSCGDDKDDSLQILIDACSGNPSNSSLLHTPSSPETSSSTYCLTSSLSTLASSPLSSNLRTKAGHIKRPLNSFMLYRGILLKLGIVLNVVKSIENSIDLNNPSVLRKLHDNDPSLVSQILKLIPTVVKTNHQVLGQAISMLWVTESSQVKEQFGKFSQVEKRLHKLCYPNYKFNPHRSGSSKGRKT